jgi:hypothetical protein
VRRPTRSFGWLDDRLLREGWLERLGPHGTAVLVLLALAADRHGASFWSREKMSRALSTPRGDVDWALGRLRELELVDHRPWTPQHPDGVWQLLPVPPTPWRT